MAEMKFEPDEIRTRAYKIRRIASVVKINRSFTNMGTASGDVADEIKTLGDKLMALGTAMAELYEETANLLAQAASELEKTDEAIGESY